MSNEINRFLELDNGCPIDDTGEYHQLAIQLARTYCGTKTGIEVGTMPEEGEFVGSQVYNTIGTDSGRIKS